MAAAASKVSWIAQQWKRGWDRIPVIMACHCIAAPSLIFLVIPCAFFPNSWLARKTMRDTAPPKYRASYTVMRSDDPRVASINNKSRLDHDGIFSW